MTHEDTENVIKFSYVSGITSTEFRTSRRWKRKKEKNRLQVEKSQVQKSA